jgi:hypothetical protein
MFVTLPLDVADADPTENAEAEFNPVSAIAPSTATPARIETMIRTLRTMMIRDRFNVQPALERY